MNSSLVIASVLLAGVALGVNAYRINGNYNDNQDQSSKYTFFKNDCQI